MCSCVVLSGHFKELSPKFVICTAFSKSGSMLSTRRTALNLGFAGRGPEISEAIPSHCISRSTEKAMKAGQGTLLASFPNL